MAISPGEGDTDTSLAGKTFVTGGQYFYDGRPGLGVLVRLNKREQGAEGKLLSTRRVEYGQF